MSHLLDVVQWLVIVYLAAMNVWHFRSAKKTNATIGRIWLSIADAHGNMQKLLLETLIDQKRGGS